MTDSDRRPVSYRRPLL